MTMIALDTVHVTTVLAHATLHGQDLHVILSHAPKTVLEGGHARKLVACFSVSAHRDSLELTVAIR